MIPVHAVAAEYSSDAVSIQVAFDGVNRDDYF